MRTHPYERHLKFAIAIIAATLPILLVFKWIQRSENWRTSDQGHLERWPGLANSLVDGISGRLDDPSFWVILASALAGWQILHGLTCFSHRPLLNPVRLSFFHMALWLVGASVFIAGYLIFMYGNGETFFFIFDKNQGNNPVVLKIQFAEGMLCALVISLSFFFLPFGVSALADIRARIEARKANGGKATQDECDSASALLSAGTAPTIAAAIAALVSQFFSHNFNGASSVIAVLGALALFCIPFIVILFYGMIALHPHFKFKIKVFDRAFPFLGVWFNLKPR